MGLFKRDLSQSSVRILTREQRDKRDRREKYKVRLYLCHFALIFLGVISYLTGANPLKLQGVIDWRFEIAIKVVIYFASVYMLLILWYFADFVKEWRSIR